MLWGCSSNAPNSGSAPSGKGPTAGAKSDSKSAPAFDLASVAGLESPSLKLDDIKGKITIVDFWATWCNPCITEIPNYNALQEKYKGKDVRMVGVTVESGSLDDVKPYIDKLGIKYPVVMGNDEVVEGFGGLIGFPTTFVVDKEGKIYQKYLGVRPNKKELIDKDIQKLLSQ